MVDAQEALSRLKQGNARFVDGELSSDILASPARRSSLAEDQTPFAIVLGCSDSRVPAEIIFDRGLGDLFVIRVAGNVVAPSQIASIEYAAERFGTRLVVVLGHSRCGAVQATLDELRQPDDKRSPQLGSIVGRIRPAVEDLLQAKLAADESALMAAAVEANILASVENLIHGSETLESQVASGGLRIVGAHYSLDSGKVTFFE
jgi:carbonic anhydrase